MDKTQTKQIDDDDTNDFNDDYSIIDTLRTEGNITKDDDEGRARKGNKKQGYGYDDERDGWSYGYGGYGNKLTIAFIFFVANIFINIFPLPPSFIDQKKKRISHNLYVQQQQQQTRYIPYITFLFHSYNNQL